ncbi:MAG: ATP-binding protein [Candidatus Tectimicrobiota bacterium]
MRGHLPRPSLSQILPVVFFLLAALPAAAIGILVTRSAWERELRTVREQHLQLARNLTAALTRYTEDVEAVFAMAVANVAEQQGVRRLGRLLGSLHVKYVAIVDRQGRITGLVAPESDLHLESLPATLVEQVWAGSQWEILPDALGEPTLFLGRPLESERYAVAAVHPRYVTELQEAIAFGAQGHAVIVDRRGRVIAHPNPHWRATRRDLSSLAPVQHMLAGDTGVARFLSPAIQTEVIAGFSTVPGAGWGVMIPQPMAELRGQVQHVQRTTWLVIALALCVAALLGVLISRWLAAPLRRIGAVAERFANGLYSTRVPALERWQIRETATLATQFNTMADEVARAWEAHQASEQRFRDFAQIAADWFWETDGQQTFHYISPAPAGGRQREIAERPGHYRGSYVYGDPEGRVVARIQAAMDQAEPFHDIEYQVLGQNGRPIYVSVSGQPIRDTRGQVTGYRGITRDITDRLVAEGQLRQAQQDMQQRQSQKMEALGVLAGGIAHDFNNILTAILGYADLAVHDVPPTSQTHRYLQAVIAAGQRAQGLVQQLLTFSRASEPERLPIQLHVIVKEALKLLRASLPATIEVREEIAREAGTVLADPTQMHQVLINLGVNAEHAMRDTGGILDVCLEAIELETPLLVHHTELLPGPYVRLTVRDTGHGMSPTVAGRVFEPFYTTKEVGQGTGMGLAVVHGIVTSHGGAITMQSHPGEGTIFTIYLPRLDLAMTEEHDTETLAPFGSGTILFVDDEPSIATLGQRLLEHWGYQVFIDTSSLSALELFRQAPQRFDLVITDQTMPQMTGDALARALRQIRPDIPIILYTGFSHAIDAAQASAQGIDALLLKPLVGRDLALAVHQVLQQRRCTA